MLVLFVAKQEIDIEKIVVIGGGAAGMTAAGIAAERGLEVTIIEKNPLLGKKLLITGKGRCNLTKYCEVPELIKNVPVNGKFLTNAFYRFSAFDTIEFFNKLGLETKIERGNRVFPKSGKASDVVLCLENYLKKNKVRIIHKKVKSITNNLSGFEITLSGNVILFCDKMIIATGGKSYPGTGSTGDGYKFARKFGHTIIPQKPSLVPIETENFYKSLQGLSLKNIAIQIFDKSRKKVYEDFGEMLFTHFGVSGPVILSASSHVRHLDHHLLKIDLKAALSPEQLDKRMQRDFQNDPNKSLENVLKLLLPKKMIPKVSELSEITGKEKVNQITKEERKRIVLVLKNLTIELEKFRPLKEAIITSGGVDVNEIDPKTMESKPVKGLFFAGEIIDVDAYTGGFNLQIAWSTGYAAGMSC